MSDGMLTQVINNLSRTGEAIQKFGGLPANAIPIQHNIQNAISTLLPDIKQMQLDVTTWGLKLEAQLDEKLTVLESLSPSELTLFIRQSEEEIARVMRQVDKVKEHTKSTDNIVIDNNMTLQRIIIDLQAAIAGLQSNLQGSQQKLDELNKKKYYFIALGILGIPGLIAMAVMLSDAQNKVSSLERQIASQQSDIRQQQSFATQTVAFSQDLLELSNHMLKIGNAIEFVSNDIQNAEKNISGGEAEKLTKLFFTAAKMSVKALLVDVS
ncbi:hypothetical protein FCL49_17580 [Serratia proteamaculans]|uniref:hypothetical protein n=1 Tax=Serratia TaxID=613 RepID=UPI0015755407|nr:MULTISPECIES: hypothetical protein [Serratia]NTX80631.1 hypothetical protein [Serratia proteamaculans]NTZ29897.1 hypothetical protein [Serratia proteamaculans]CAI1071603.1 Uncharacterised protein [Serratia quinivorans]